MKIAQKNNFFQRRYVLLFFFIFLALYLLFSFCLYLYQSYTYGYLAHKRLLATFVKKHNTVLQKEVFQKAFNIGQFCEDSKIESVRTVCYEKISRLIANSIPEEELAPGGYNWPNDLFFVKQDGRTFHRIGWNGK